MADNQVVGGITGASIQPGLIESVRSTLSEQVGALHRLSTQLDSQQYQQAKRHVIPSGIGKSGHVGRKISAMLASAGTPGFFIHPAEAFHGDVAGQVRIFD